MIPITKKNKNNSWCPIALISFFDVFILLECDEAMGMESGKIADSNLKASSEVCYVRRHFELLYTRISTSIFLISP